MLDGIRNFLNFIDENWTSILVIISLAIGIVRKIISLVKKSNDEKIEIVKAQIKESILKMITDAEVDYESWVKAGAIKRSQVINRIFDEYPILSKIAHQEEVIQWIDEMIDNALVELRKIIARSEESGAAESEDHT